jgi:hypothetical protein
MVTLQTAKVSALNHRTTQTSQSLLLGNAQRERQRGKVSDVAFSICVPPGVVARV